ncbi:hypothetical protein [Streptomyces sp. NPDC018610]|uniref:hypothetical protein n=1 Tax=Streptomyces sp. NPDC018610 TaxID=3365049 RepID=UPI0037B367B3
MTDDLPEQPDAQPATEAAVPSAPAAPPTIPAPPLPTVPPMQPVPPKSRISPLAAGILGLAVGAGIVGSIWAITANSGPGTPETFTLKGTFTLTEDASDNGLGGCEGTGGYEDIQEGASVTVYGAGGDVIATGSLGDSDSPGYGTCAYDIAIPDVPKGEKFYKVEVSHRGTVQMTAEEAENGELAATLG